MRMAYSKHNKKPAITFIIICAIACAFLLVFFGRKQNPKTVFFTMGQIENQIKRMDFTTIKLPSKLLTLQNGEAKIENASIVACTEKGFAFEGYELYYNFNFLPYHHVPEGMILRGFEGLLAVCELCGYTPQYVAVGYVSRVYLVCSAEDQQLVAVQLPFYPDDDFEPNRRYPFITLSKLLADFERMRVEEETYGRFSEY